jgi:hypothetical protein
MVLDSESIVRCYSCNTFHHAACWIENKNRCSVFHCNTLNVLPAQKRVYAESRVSFLIAIHTAINIVLHFFINSFGLLVDAFHIQDALIVCAIETSVLASAIVLLTRYRRAGLRFEESPLVVFALVILVWNIIFLSGLLWYCAANGIPALFALIRL